MKYTKFVILSSALVLLGAGCTDASEVGVRRADYPATASARGKLSLTCQAILSAGINSDPTNNKIEGSVREGTDRVSITKKNESALSFLPSGSFDSGVSNGFEFLITKDDEAELVALSVDPDTNVFTLNKSTGLAVWIKSRSSFLFSDDPTGEVIYMKCQ